MLKIYIARHGEDQDNANGILNGRRDMALTEKGKTQARELAGNINSLGLKFDAIYSSPLLRTRQTAQIIANETENPRPILVEDLVERDFGVMTGEPIATVPERCSPNILPAEKITYFLEAEGAETFPDLLVRAHKVLAAARLRHAAGSILLVTHGDFGKMLYASFYKLSWEQVLTQFHFGNSELLLLAEDSPAAETHVFRGS